MAKEPKKAVGDLNSVVPAKKPATGKTAAPKAAKSAGTAVEKKVAAPRKSPAPKAVGSPRAQSKPGASEAAKTTVTPEQRYRMIQEAAYFIAEKHGFAGDTLGFWVQAEQEIDATLSS
jgi:hypothetical protein